MRKILSTAFILLLIDQIVKVWVKTHMFLGQEYLVFDWFIIHFIENNGMAFGLQFPGYWGKVLLTLFRIIVVVFGIKYIISFSKNKLPSGLLIALGLIIGGAIGNIIDSTFYGLIFSESYFMGEIASIFPKSRG